MRVLIALDNSPRAAGAAQRAVWLLASMPDVHYLVINVAPMPIGWAGMSGLGAVMPLSELPPWPAGSATEAPESDDLARVAEQASQAGVPDPEVLRATGDAAAEICRAADEHDVDLIVVGTHHRRLLERLLDPSVAHEVVRASTRPVLVISADRR
jgi:nucleotide-binding universal stress UspA family protein